MECQSKWNKHKESAILKICAYVNDWDENDSNKGTKTGVGPVLFKNFGVRAWFEG